MSVIQNAMKEVFIKMTIEYEVSEDEKKKLALSNQIIKNVCAALPDIADETDALPFNAKNFRIDSKISRSKKLTFSLKVFDGYEYVKLETFKPTPIQLNSQLEDLLCNVLEDLGFNLSGDGHFYFACL